MLEKCKRGYNTTPSSPRTAKKAKVNNHTRNVFEAGKAPSRKFKCGSCGEVFMSKSYKTFATHYNKGRCGNERVVEPNE